MVELPRCFDDRIGVEQVPTKDRFEVFGLEALEIRRVGQDLGDDGPARLGIAPQLDLDDH